MAWSDTGATRSALIAMSGGVDSSVAAYRMLEAGYRCTGAMMKLHDDVDAENTCCSLDDALDARATAARLGIPFYVFHFAEDFRREVVDRFVRAYESGLTPNPCVDCNRHLKFGRFLDRALELGLDGIATGHYARVSLDRGSGRYLLEKAADAARDQSYFLCALTQDQLARTSLPLGGLTKAEVREIAREQGFVNARKHDSQDLCFAPDGDYLAFLERYTGRASEPGDFLDPDGRPIGRHRGAAGYTLGQRRGLGLACGERVYVCGKSMAQNTVTVGPEALLYARELIARDINWIALAGLDSPLRVRARTRSRQPEQPATAYPMDGGRLRLVFDEPQRAMTPGQAVALYDGPTVLAGGVIESTAEGGSTRDVCS